MKGRIFKSVVVAMLAFVSHLAHAGTVTYVYTDPQGTPLAEADASGTITATFDYKPYGSQALGSPKAGPGYTGHVNDPDTGFVYMQARYYDPVVGQFLSVDPVVPSPGNSFHFNRYDYANNNPVGNLDPNGLSPRGLGADVCMGNMQCTSESNQDSSSGRGGLPSSRVSSSLPGRVGDFSIASLFGISSANASERVDGGTQTIGIENPIFSFPGVPYISALKLSNATFEGHIKPRHAFDIGEGGAGRFSRGILNRTTSQSFFSSELAAMINQGAVEPAPYPAMPGGVRLFVTLPGTIGTTISGAPTSVVVIGLHPAGVPGVYSIDTAFPFGK